MKILLMIVGGIWAAIGLGNLIMSPAIQNGETGWASAALLVNVLLFIIPGLILCGVGAAIPKATKATKAAGAMPSFCIRCGTQAQASSSNFCAHYGGRI
jgi:hypothetical protein